MIKKCEWTDLIVELELWTRLAKCAHEIKDHTNVELCAKQAFGVYATILEKQKHDQWVQ